MFIIDAHLDLAMNAVEWDRDLRKSVPVLRQLEKGMTDKPDRANGTVSLPQLRQGNIGLVVATQIARVETPGTGIKGWQTAEQAWAQSRGEGVRVAILDTGISKHPDLNWQDDLAFNCSNDPSYLDEVSGHGTHVAGIVGARDNSLGVVGVAPECTLIPIKVLNNKG